MNKQIEEVKNLIAEKLCDSYYEGKCDYGGDCDLCGLTAILFSALYNAGYRNEKETAREILQELYKLSFQQDSYADRIIDIRASIENLAEKFGVEVEND